MVLVLQVPRRRGQQIHMQMTKNRNFPKKNIYFRLQEIYKIIKFNNDDYYSSHSNKKKLMTANYELLKN